MKEEGRFAYDERARAEEKLEALRAKSKKLYFIQPVKELLVEDGVATAPPAPPEPEELEIPKAKAKPRDDDDESDGEEADGEEE